MGNKNGAKNGGEGGIRTLGTLLAYTRLAGVHLRPLGHLSAFFRSLPKLKSSPTNHPITHWATNQSQLRLDKESGVEDYLVEDIGSSAQ